MSDAFYKSSFSSIIQHSCMENKCSSCPWIVSEFASHQYCFCVVKYVDTVHTKHKKVRSAGKGLAPLKAGHELTPVV